MLGRFLLGVEDVRMAIAAVQQPSMRFVREDGGRRSDPVRLQHNALLYTLQDRPEPTGWAMAITLAGLARGL